MNRHDAALLAYWRKGPLARAIGEREGTGLAHNGGTPRHPRTARTARRKGYHPQHRFAPDNPAPAPFVRLLASGYYDDLRRAFHDAEE